MCLGYIKILESEYDQHKDAIKTIKYKHNTHAEIKWTNLSSTRLPLYKELIDYFFTHELFFHSILVSDKKNLIEMELAKGVSKEDIYYNLILTLLRSQVYSNTHLINVYLDVKDTRGRFKVKKLYERMRDADLNRIDFIYFQHLHSHENVLLQLTDLFIGAIAYKTRGEDKKENASRCKLEVIQYLEQRSNNLLDDNGATRSDKFNIVNINP
jgi:hypothetical protein